MNDNCTLPVCSVTVVLVAAMLLAPGVAHADIPLMLNHQGMIKVGTTPFTGTGHFRFAVYSPGANQNIWTNDGSGTGTAEMPDNPVAIPVNDGIYSLGIGDASLSNMSVLSSQVFNGSEDDLVLRVWFDDQSLVDEAQLLQPDRPISSTAYAFHAGNADMLGGRSASEYVRGEDGYMTYCLLEHSGTDAAMEVVNTSSGAGTAIYAGTDGEEGKAIDAHAAGDESIGVKASSTGVNGTGVHAEANDADGRGVYASSSGASGTGVYAFASGASGRAVYAEVSGASAKAVHGVATSTATGTNYGGQFEAKGSTGRGVHAKAMGSAGRGLYAEASGAHARGVYSEVTGENAVAVEGFSGGANSYGALLANDDSGNSVELAGSDNAGFFQGDLVTTDDYKYHSPKTYTLQVVPIDFQFISLSTSRIFAIWDTEGYLNVSPDGGNYDAPFHAAVNLPNGATVTGFRIYFYDHDAGALVISAWLKRRPIFSTAIDDMAYALADTGGGGTSAIQHSEDTSITHPVIDNGAYQYWIRANLNFDLSYSKLLRFYGASIEYTMDTVSP